MCTLDMDVVDFSLVWEQINMKRLPCGYLCIDV